MRPQAQFVWTEQLALQRAAIANDATALAALLGDSLSQGKRPDEKNAQKTALAAVVGNQPGILEVWLGALKEQDALDLSPKNAIACPKNWAADIGQNRVRNLTKRKIVDLQQKIRV